MSVTWAGWAREKGGAHRDLLACKARGGRWHSAQLPRPLAPSLWPDSEVGARNLVGQGSFLTGRSSGQLWVEQGDMDPGLMEVGA